MRLAWELDWPGSKIEPNITSLAWIGDNEHGQLAVGSESGVVGITLTDYTPPHHAENTRYNFNLRGHQSAVTCVTWNTAKGKLASSDQNGVIYVWSRNDERWSVELVNERGVKVRDVKWSPCGGAAIICYEDNFILIGSASGQRIWSATYPNTHIVLCGVWLNDERLVLIQLNGIMQLLSKTGSSIAERTLCQNEELFRITSPSSGDKMAILAKSGFVYILHSFDQVDPFVLEDIPISFIEWSPDGKYLAALTQYGQMYIVDDEGRLLHRDCLDVPSGKRVTSMTWAHNGNVMIVAVGGHIHVARIFTRVPTLYRLLSYKVWRLLGGETSKLATIDIPLHEKDSIKEYDHHIIRCRIPARCKVNEFVSTLFDPRCYCTIKSNGPGTNNYSLCIEHMGGLVPILIGRLVSRFVPHFDISIHPSVDNIAYQRSCGRFAQVEDALSLPLSNSLNRHSTPQRMNLWRRSKRRIRTLISRRYERLNDNALAHISSNVCCTRFNITKCNKSSKDILAQVNYKTSVLHLQPRQMTVKLVDIEDIGAEKELALLNSVVGECSALSLVVNKGDKKKDNRQICTSTSNDWNEQVDNLEYIDGDGDESSALVNSNTSQRDVMGSKLNRLNIGTSQNKARMKEEGPDYLIRIRDELRELQEKVEEIERKASGNDVKKDLRTVGKRIKKVKAAISEHDRRVYTLHNKTPFWNEQNQVYQLDFGGRVTQESAKNFQIEVYIEYVLTCLINDHIEFDNVQSLQFGRIEGGAYTLDFRRPFSAIQAFAIALASITQRLK